ncbi:MAG: Rieske 2Fe-2S domain-containing protein [Cytophagales bacterium]|nr:Rieske 2Fe-2S domain-containing protein [Armatimonadota bacterium]
MADGKVISAQIDAQEWLEPIADKMQGAVQAAYDAAGPAKKPIENALNGVWMGHVLHPAVVTVPIGAWTVTAALDLLEGAGKSEYAPGADASLAVGLAGAASAAVTGLTQWYPHKEASVKKTGAAHALLNITATVLYGASYAARKQGNRGAGRALGFLGYGLVMTSAYLGGELAHEKNLGADHAPRRGLPAEFIPVLSAAALPENAPTLAQTGDLKLVLVKQGARIHALANSCSHHGGPLSEGRLENGCLVCPWHGSRFRLEDGHNEDGPATFAQPCFETRVKNGQIEVRTNTALPQNRQ